MPELYSTVLTRKQIFFKACFVFILLNSKIMRLSESDFSDFSPNREIYVSRCFLHLHEINCPRNLVTTRESTTTRHDQLCSNIYRSPDFKSDIIYPLYPDEWNQIILIFPSGEWYKIVCEAHMSFGFGFYVIL